MTLRRFSSAKKFFGAIVRIYSQGDSNVTSSGAPALLQNGTTMISIANRVIAIGYQSVIAVRRVKAQSRRVEASAFYKSTTLKRKPNFSTVLFYGRARFLCTAAQPCATHCK